jgi:hypothetical protein
MKDPLAQKKQENIAAYVVSMWHLEDLLRAHRFDPRLIEEQLVAPMDADAEVRAAMLCWYTDMARRMQEQGVGERGHLSEVEEVMNELEFLHRTLVDVLNDPDYDALYAKAEAGIKSLQDAAGEDADGPITTCFTAIYGVMVLRARKQDVSAATTESEGHMRRLLERLGQHYRQMRKLPGVSMN